jgi:hypothetical protein
MVSLQLQSGRDEGVFVVVGSSGERGAGFLASHIQTRAPLQKAREIRKGMIKVSRLQVAGREAYHTHSRSPMSSFS